MSNKLFKLFPHGSIEINNDNFIYNIYEQDQYGKKIIEKLHNSSPSAFLYEYLQKHPSDISEVLNTNIKNDILNAFTIFIGNKETRRNFIKLIGNINYEIGLLE